MFSARAHMVHPGWYVSRGHLNAVIAEEVSRPDAVTNTLEVAAVLFDGEQRMAAIQQQMQQAGGSSDYSSSVQKQPPPAAVAAQPTAATAAGVAPLEQRREQRSDAVAYIAPSATSAGDCTRVALSPELSLRRSTTSRPSSPPLANGTLSGALVEPDDVTTVAAPPDAARSRDTSSSSPDVLALKQQQQLRRTLSGSPSATSTSGGTAAVRQSVPTVLAESTEPLALPRTPPSRGGAGASTTAPLSPATPPGGCSGRDVSPHPVVSGNTTIYGSQVLVSDSGDTYLAPPDDLVRREFHKSNTLIKAYTESYHVTKSRVLTRVALAVANRLAAPAAAAAPPAVPSGKRGSGKGKQQGLGEQSQEGAGGEPSDRQAAVMALAQELAQLFRFELMHG